MDLWRDKNVLVTGAGGFIGSHLAERFVRAGKNVGRQGTKKLTEQQFVVVLSCSIRLLRYGFEIRDRRGSCKTVIKVDGLPDFRDALQ